MDGCIQENGEWAQGDFTFEGVLLDGRVQDGPVNDDDNDVEHEASRVEELQEPEIPGRGPVGLASKVAGVRPGQSVSVPRVQGKVAAEEEGADIREKEKELHRRLMRAVPEPEPECHRQVHGTAQSKEK